MTNLIATPAKLRDGSWGARVRGTVAAGQTVTIKTKGGKSWDAAIVAVLWSGDGASLCSTRSLDGAGRREPTDLDGNTARMGHHWSQRGRGPEVRLCSGGCGRRVSSRYASCFSCHREMEDAM